MSRSIKKGPFVEERRITSYNVCYTKLLRNSLTLFLSMAVFEILSAIISSAPAMASSAVLISNSVFIYSFAIDTMSFVSSLCIKIISASGSSPFSFAIVALVRLAFRITSYNVCYTKLLRKRAAAGFRHCANGSSASRNEIP